MQTQDPKSQLNFAHPLFRFYAMALDLGLLYMLIIISKRFLGDLVWSPTATVQDIAVLIAYFLLPTAIWGRTLGKWALGIKVTDERGGPPGVLAIPRELAGRFVAVAVLGIGLVWIVFDKRKQGWHDKIASTYVVYARNPFLKTNSKHPK